MPTYEYECSKCGYKFEEFQGITAEPLKSCPKCKKQGLRRLIGTGSAVIFKGAGFYANDYKKKEKQDGKNTCPAKKDKSCNGCSLNKDAHR